MLELAAEQSPKLPEKANEEQSSSQHFTLLVG